MEAIQVLLLTAMAMSCHTATNYNTVKSDYETFLTAYEDIGSSGKSISADLVIPKETSSSSLVVYLNMALYAIMDFEVAEGKLELVGSVSMEWTDNVKTLKGVTFSSTVGTIFFTQDQIWTPNLVLVNSADSIESIGDATYKIRYNTSSGLCQWNPRVLILASCTPDATYFPFDDQKCTLSIKPWKQESSLITLQVSNDKWDTSEVQGSRVWDLEDTKSSISFSGDIHVAEFEITIKRKPLFMAIVIVLPILLLSVLSGFLFLLPPASGERVGFGITCFLSFVILLQTIMQLLPNSSDPMSFLCYYVILMLTLSAVLSIVNIFLLRLYMSPGKDEVPKAFIYFYKTIKCRPCRFCYLKTKQKIKPPCVSALDKMKLASRSFISFVSRVRCPKCRRLNLEQEPVKDKVRNEKFQMSRLFSHRNASETPMKMSMKPDTVLDRDGMFVRSRKQVLSEGPFTDSNSKFKTKAETENLRRKDGLHTTGLSNTPQLDNTSNFCIDEGNLESPSTSGSFEMVAFGAIVHKNYNQASSSWMLDDRGMDVVEREQTSSKESKGIHRVSSLVIDVEEASLVKDTPERSGAKRNSVSDVSSLNQTMQNQSSVSSGTSSGYGSFPSAAVSRSYDSVAKKHSSRTLEIGITEADIEVISDISDDDGNSVVDDEDEILLVNLTWEFVGQVLDYFFIFTFIALQVTFTVFFLVPLGARYA